MDAKETEIIFEILREPRREVALFSEAQRRNEDLIRQLQEEGLTSDQIERIRDGEDPEDVFKE
jgi:xanthine/CO dehydrogenase XdhC/CoxF family maturation factor